MASCLRSPGRQVASFLAFPYTARRFGTVVAKNMLPYFFLLFEKQYLSDFLYLLLSSNRFFRFFVAFEIEKDVGKKLR